MMAIAFMLVAGSVSAQSTKVSATSADAKLKLSETKVEISVGEKRTLKVSEEEVGTARTTKIAAEKVTWKSSNEKVATVDKNGTIVAKGAGETTITVSKGEMKSECRVVVPEGKTVPKTTKTTKTTTTTR